MLLVVAVGHECTMIKAKIKQGCFNWFVSKIRRKFELDENLMLSVKYAVVIQGKTFKIRIQDDEDMEILNSYSEKGKMLCTLVNITAMNNPGAIIMSTSTEYGYVGKPFVATEGCKTCRR